MTRELPVSRRTRVFTTHPFNQLPLPVAESLCSLSVFLSGGQRAALVHVEPGRGVYGKGVQRLAQACLILVSEESSEGRGASLLLLSSPFLAFSCRPSKKGPGC